MFEPEYMDWPREVSLETYAKCNASCVFCPYVTLERIGTKMPDELIDKVIGELEAHPEPFLFAPFKVNEPFLDKRLIDICRKVETRTNGIIRIFTNGSALTDKHIDGVASLQRVFHLWVSLNDHRPKRYKDLMGLDFAKTASNLDRLHEREFPHEVVLSKVRTSTTQDDEEFTWYCNDRWPKFKTHLIKADGWLGDIPLGSDEIPDGPCGRWWELNITATGKVALCCMDSAAEWPIGDITKQSLYEVYNSKFYRQRREEMWSRKRIMPCASCSY